MIQIDNLSKRYGKFEALKKVSFEVGKGQVFGFVGPNGAGKTTTMSILSTLLAPTSGKAYVGGFDVVKYPKKVKQLIGYMPDFFGVYDNLKVYEYLNFYASCYGISKAEREQVIPKILELVNLSHKNDSYVDLLSRGMKQRLGLARCLIHNPEVLILDEPASGLDPRARIEMKEILKELRNMGKTIIISSHILSELAEMSDVIGVIEDGKMITIGSVDEIHSRMNEQKRIKFRSIEDMDKLDIFLRENPYITSTTREGNYLVAGFNGTDNEQAQLLNEIVKANFRLLSFAEIEGKLEDIFLEITKGVGQ